MSQVICIDDNPEILQLLEFTLQEQFSRVISTTSGEEGLKLVMNNLPDLVILDLNLADIDGWQLYQKFKTTLSTRLTPFVLLTANTMINIGANKPPLQIREFQHPVDQIIMPPFSKSEFLMAVDKALNKCTLSEPITPIETEDKNLSQITNIVLIILCLAIMGIATFLLILMGG